MHVYTYVWLYEYDQIIAPLKQHKILQIFWRLSNLCIRRAQSYNMPDLRIEKR